MKNVVLTMIVAMSLFAISVRAQEEAKSVNPYARVVARNIFGLAPAKPEVPTVEVPVLPKITPTGTMTIFGELEVLFTVTEPAVSGLPAREDSYVLREAEAEAGIEVLQINQAAGLILFSNHGTIQQLPLSSPTVRPGQNK